MGPVHLTQRQIQYLHLGPSADGEVTLQGFLTIEEQDKNGWIFVHQTDNYWSEPEGSGVWVDQEGREHYGP